MLFTDLLSLHLVTFLVFYTPVHGKNSRCMLELKFAIYCRAASLSSQASSVDVCSIDWIIIDQTRLSSNTPCTPNIIYALMLCDCVMLSFQTETSWCQWLQVVDPVALPLLPEIGVTASHLFCDQDGEVTQGMSQDVEVGSYWFLCSVTFDVTAVSIEADMAGILCFSHILLLASSAFDKLYSWCAGLAGGCSPYVEGLASSGANKCIPRTDVLASEAMLVATWAATMVWFTFWSIRAGCWPKGCEGSLVGGRPQWGALEWPVGGNGRHELLVGLPSEGC